ncbi:MAG TPA: T9SS type A sorting domain-containing protein [Bacteroidia bacterium]|nr:T9SS type A sorting domain-containing protein [Bacteroidia bacterium]
MKINYLLKWLFGLTVAGLLTPLLLDAQQRPSPADKKQMHVEAEDDPYLPNAFGNKKTSPAYTYQTPTSARVTGSTIFTTQVNIDGAGQNIIGDAANEPNIAINALNTNQIVIGWRQFDNVTSNFRQAGWSHTNDAGQTWVFPGLIEPGIFRSDPVLDYDNNGEIYYNSLTSTFECKVFKSANGGASWNSGTDAAGGDKQWMAIDRTGGIGEGNIYSAWTSAYSTCLPGFHTRSTDGGQTYENCILVDGDPFWMTMTIGNSGELFIGGGSDLSDSLVVVKSLNAQIPASVISWEPPVYVSMDGYLNGWGFINPQGLNGQVNIDVDRSNGPGQGNVYLLAPVTRLSNNDPGDIMFSRSTDGGLTWSAPIRVNDDSSTLNMQWFGTMSVAPNGRIDAIWLDTREFTGSDFSALYYSYSYDQGNTWSVNEKLSPDFDPHLGYPNQDKMGDYFDMISDNTGAHLAWANTLNGEEDVYYSRIIPPLPIGITEVSPVANISVFPNPASETITVSGAPHQTQLQLYNVLGSVIYADEMNTSSLTINVSAFPAGVYMLRCSDSNGNTSVKKVVIK